MPGIDTRKCKHCGRAIVPTPYGTWGDAVDPEYEVCELSDDYGPSHEPLTYQVLVDDIPWTDADGNDTWDTKQEATAIAGHCDRQGYTSVEIEGI